MKNKPDKLVEVPQADIDTIEAARIALYDTFDSDVMMRIMHITSSMWKISHKKYKVIDKV